MSDQYSSFEKGDKELMNKTEEEDATSEIDIHQKAKHVKKYTAEEDKNLFSGMQTIDKQIQMKEGSSRIKVVCYNIFKLRLIPYFVEFIGTMVLAMSVSLTFILDEKGNPTASPIQGIAVGVRKTFLTQLLFRVLWLLSSFNMFTFQVVTLIQQFPSVCASDKRLLF
jgi:hypothetical protein